MKLAPVVLLAALAIPAAPSLAAEDDDGWSALSHALTLIQTLVRIGAHAENPQQGFDDVLAGRNTEANRALAGLLEEAMSDMPAQHREKVTAIGRDLAAMARKHPASAAAGPVSVEGPLQARKELTAMGLRYYDERQFLDAVKRDDALAVELFIAGRGVNLASRDAQGRGALDIARANGNTPLAEMLARSLPAKR